MVVVVVGGGGGGGRMGHPTDPESRMCRQKLNLYGACIRAFKRRRGSHPRGIAGSPLQTASSWWLVGQGRAEDADFSGSSGSWVTETQNGLKKGGWGLGSWQIDIQSVLYVKAALLSRRPKIARSEFCLPALTPKPRHPECVKFSDLIVCVLNMFRLWTTILYYMGWWSLGLTKKHHFHIFQDGLSHWAREWIVLVRLDHTPRWVFCDLHPWKYWLNLVCPNLTIPD